jgi:hypothetical protein
MTMAMLAVVLCLQDAKVEQQVLARVNEVRKISVMDVVSGRGGGPAAIVAYPADKQKDVPLALGREIPRPAPTDAGGYPVTLTFHEDQKVTGVTATLRVDKEDVEFHLSTPEKPADARYQRNTVCLIAEEPLKPATTCAVTVTAKVGTKPFTRTWSFTTAKE